MFAEVQVVKQMNVVSASNQPTVAIITANYCEKMAVDAMMENKTTYVKYKTGGNTGFMDMISLMNSVTNKCK